MTCTGTGVVEADAVDADADDEPEDPVLPVDEADTGVDVASEGSCSWVVVCVCAGVLATMADHTSGCAARGAVGVDHDVVSVEFKINFLRPAVADRLRCRGRVLRAGKMLVICEAEVFAEKDAEEKLVSKAMVTLAVKRAF